jgi:threonylcarbamoyladenosine tRNA methylthiotransferase MtaB
MGRPYLARSIKELVDDFRRIAPEGGVTGDVIVGFPGEKDEDFQACLAFVREVAFHRLHVFRYSPREGTVAASMDRQVPEWVKYTRAKQMRSLAREVSGSALRAFIGKTLPVLIEKEPDSSTGLPGGYAHNYARVLISSGLSALAHAGEICPVEILREKEGTLLGIAAGHTVGDDTCAT